MECVTAASVWLSYHLFRDPPFEDFLRSVVAPFVQDARSKGLLDGFFFVRYWEGGPHIRLRFRTAYPDALHARIRSHFTDERPQPDTLEEASYVAEVDRYGGPECIGVAEQQFDASSRAVLSALAAAPWSYDRALGCAMQLHLATLHVFQRRLSIRPSEFARQSVQLLSADPSSDQETLRLIPAFEKSYQESKDGLVPMCEAIWTALNAGEMFDENWINTWVRDLDDVALKLGRVFAIDNLARSRAFSIIGSLVHMTNNRLGVRRRDESYIAYVLARALGERLDRPR